MQKRSLVQDGLEVSASGPGSIGMTPATVLPAIGRKWSHLSKPPWSRY
jgi:hypothetical protein